MSYAGLKPQTFLALRTAVKKNAHYITDREILYPAGAVLILHDYSRKSQRHILLMEKSIFLEMIVVSPSRTLAAIIINDEKGHIVIYDMKSLKKKRTLNLPHDAITKRFVHMCFSHDEKLLLTLTGEPDWMMLSYNWEKGKVETFTRANYINNPSPVSQVLSSPTDSAVCCILGPGIFRLMTMQETVWRQYGFQKADQVNVTSAAFLGSDRVLVGTADGRLLLVDSGELKAVHDATNVEVISVAEKEDGGTTQPVQIPKATANDSNTDRQVRAITPFNKGFVYSCEVGMVHFFEKEGKNTYKRRNLLKITDADYREEQQIPLNIVQHISINQSQDKLLATTNRSQIYTAQLWAQNATAASKEVVLEHMGESLHHGPISGLAMCVWKPVFLTCGAQDRTVRLWNYQTSKLEMLKQYEENVLSVALHPTALFAAIGFADQLRYMIVLLDDIQPYTTFAIPECHLSAFSKNGHYLAAVNRFLIIIYSTISFHAVCSLKGHSAKVTSLAWSADDSTLVSCGADGAVYEWHIGDGSRAGEVVNKGVSYWECTVTNDNKYIYAVGNDGKLKEIRESNVLRTFGVGQKDLPHVVLSRSDLIMFLCGDAGILLSLKMPLIDPIDRKSFLYHNSKILQMKLTYDDRTLVTVSETGSLCIWDITEADGRTIELDKNFAYCFDVLIPKADLEDKVAKINELSLRMKELIMEQDYRIKQIESTQATSISEIHRSYGQVMQELKQEMERKDKDHIRLVNNMTTEIAALREIHETTLQETESKYNAMLIVEYEKINAAHKENEHFASENENKIAEIIQAKDNAADSVKRELESKLSTLEEKVNQLQLENEREKLEHAEIKEQIENDADREIIELKAEYEKMLRNERELYVTVRGEEGVMRKKLALTVNENHKFKADVTLLQNQLTKLQSDISSLNQDITDLKREIYDRDITIQEKEKRIYDMKKDNGELEKYKFVLSNKIQELTNQLEPKDREIEEKDKQIFQMELEMDAMQTANANMAVIITDHKVKLKNSEKEIRKLKEKHEYLSNSMKRVGIEITRISQNIQDPKLLKDGVRSLSDKYANTRSVQEAYSAQTELEAELQRKSDHLEQTVQTLKAAIARARDKPQQSAVTIQENVLLMEELNKIQSINEIQRDKIERYENILLSSSGKLVSLNDAKKKLAETLKTHQEIREEMQHKVDRAQKDVLLLQEEVNRLKLQTNSM